MRIDIRTAIYPDVEKLAEVKIFAKHGDEANSVSFDFECAYITGLLDERRTVFVSAVGQNSRGVLRGKGM